MRLLGKFILPTALNSTQNPSFRMSPEYEPQPHLYLTITLPPNRATASLARDRPSASLIRYSPTRTTASSLGTRPAIVTVKPQKKRKRDAGPGEDADDRDSDSGSDQNSVASSTTTSSSSFSPHLPKRPRTSLLLSGPLALDFELFSAQQFSWAHSMLFALIHGQERHEAMQMEELGELYSGDMDLVIPPPDLHAVFSDPLLSAVIAGAELVEVGTGGAAACEGDVEVLGGLLEELADCRAKNAAIADAIAEIEEQRWLGDEHDDEEKEQGEEEVERDESSSASSTESEQSKSTESSHDS